MMKAHPVEVARKTIERIRAVHMPPKRPSDSRKHCDIESNAARKAFQQMIGQLRGDALTAMVDPEQKRPRGSFYMLPTGLTTFFWDKFPTDIEHPVAATKWFYEHTVGYTAENAAQQSFYFRDFVEKFLEMDGDQFERDVRRVRAARECEEMNKLLPEADEKWCEAFEGTDAELTIHWNHNRKDVTFVTAKVGPAFDLSTLPPEVLASERNTRDNALTFYSPNYKPLRLHWTKRKSA